MQSPPLTLTTSEPIARALRRDYALARKTAGCPAWEVPAIFSLQRWCRDQWLQTWPTAQLLHPVQELMLWQGAIEADRAADDLLSLTALARDARATARLAARFRIDPAQGPAFTDEHEAFARWHRELRQRQREHDWVFAWELPAIVAGLVRDGRMAVPRGIRLVGAIDLITPMERDLLEALAAAGCPVHMETPAAGEAAVTAVRYKDRRHEYRGLALALRELLLPCAEDETRLPPDILVLLPDPEFRRDALEAALKPVLAPWLLLPDEGARPVPWRFSRGVPLDRHPLVAAALAICGVGEHDNSLDEISRLLLSAALWTPVEREANAQVDYRLRDAGGTRFGLHGLIELLPRDVARRFATLIGQLRAMPRRALPSAWVAHLEQRLQALGWPGEKGLSSVFFQAREHWSLALNSFSAMDLQAGALTHPQALAWLREIVASQGFQPRADHEQPIQILGLQDAAGLAADAVFVVDATDQVLPGPARRHPLLARETLLRAGVPGVTPAAALEQASALLADLRARASALHFSHAAVDEYGAECTPTALLPAHAGWRDAGNDTPLSAERAAAVPLLAWPASDPVPAVDDMERAGIRGGVRIFKDYVEAPFFALCRHRLGITTLPDPRAGIPARAQGVLIHAALETAWGELRTSEALRARSREQLGELIDGPLDRALEAALPAARFGRMARQIERARARDLLLQWLEHEKRRPEAFEVVEREQGLNLAFEGLVLRLRIDRVDRVHTRLDDERILILDYKTGRDANPRGWREDELQEPQLPLYATCAALGELGLKQVDGIAFAHVVDGHPALAPAINWGIGLIDDDDLPRFKMKDWPQQLSAWQASLTAIARGFLAGQAGVGEPHRYRRSPNEELLDLVRPQP